MQGRRRADGVVKGCERHLHGAEAAAVFIASRGAWAADPVESLALNRLDLMRCGITKENKVSRNFSVSGMREWHPRGAE